MVREAEAMATVRGVEDDAMERETDVVKKRLEGGRWE